MSTNVAADDRRNGDRRHTRRLHVPERRTGFDRRVPNGRSPVAIYQRILHAYRGRPLAIFLVLVLVTVLNLADLLYTQRALVRGGIELNPVMRFLFDIHPVWAAVVKASIGMVVVEAIWAFRRFRSALVLSIGAAVGMGALFVYHLVTQRIVPI